MNLFLQRCLFLICVHVCLFSAQLENLQKRIYQLEEQLHSEMQLKDELEQKCRYGKQVLC